MFFRDEVWTQINFGLFDLARQKVFVYFGSCFLSVNGLFLGVLSDMEKQTSIPAACGKSKKTN